MPILQGSSNFEIIKKVTSNLYCTICHNWHDKILKNNNRMCNYAYIIVLYCIFLGCYSISLKILPQKT